MKVLFQQDKIVVKDHENFITDFYGIDSLEKSKDKGWFKEYPIQNFNYEFNSWGFRGSDYEQYRNLPIIACIGDSFTVNLGEPIEHSWPSLLQKHFDIPCLNFGINGAGNDTIRLVYEKVLTLFEVKYVFVVYSFFNRRIENNILKSDYHDHEENIKHFEKNFINNAFYQFIPHYCYSIEEKEYIKTKKENYLLDLYPNWRIHDPRELVTKNNYEKLSGLDWCSYEEFLSGGDLHNDLITGKFKLSNNTKYYNNRDGFHLNLKGNQLLADNLYNQFLQGETK